MLTYAVSFVVDIVRYAPSRSRVFYFMPEENVGTAFCEVEES
jgi:hypothetical protein